DRELAVVLALAEQLLLVRFGALLGRQVAAVDGVDQRVILAVGLEEKVLGFLPVELAEPEEQAGHLFLVRRDADDLLQRFDLLVALGGDLKLNRQPELVVLQRRNGLAFVFRAGQIARQRLIGRARSALLQPRIRRIFSLPKIFLGLGLPR